MTEAASSLTTPIQTGSTFTKTVHKKAYPAIFASRPELSQTGRTVLITGGSAGIGFGIARGFAEAGAKRIIVLGRRQSLVEQAVSKLQAEYPAVEILGRQCDVDDLESTEKLWTGFEGDDIVIDVLVLNAAKISTNSPILTLGRDEVWSQFTMNVRSLLDFTERFYKQKGGKDRAKSLVNVSTAAIHDFHISAPWPAYVATKNAGTLLTQMIARDTPAEEMQMISFHPGAVYTEGAANAGVAEDQWPYDDVNLAGNFAIWAASEEARFLHGRFVWASWDIDELRTGELGDKIQKNDHYLNVGIVGLQE